MTVINTPLQKGNQIDVLDHGFVRYIDHMGTDLRVVEAARISYRSPSKGGDADKKLLGYLLRNRHTSPFEMCKVTFNIKMPIFVMRQFVRHRMQNLNEVSARYTELPNVFYVPTSWRRQDTKNKQGSLSSEEGWNPILQSSNGLSATEKLMAENDSAYQTYQELLRAGVAKEMARFVLPLNTYTEIYCTWDLNNLLKFFELRDDFHAQWEHTQFAKAMKSITGLLFPWTIEIYEEIMASKIK